MITVLKPQATPEQTEKLVDWFKSQGVDVNVSRGEYQTIIGLIGDVTAIDKDLVASLDIVETVKRVSDPFKLANRKFHADDTIIHVGDAVIGGGNMTLIAGPCSVESEEQIVEIAKDVKSAGATLLRGGAFKPRTSPYAFQGMKGEGLKLLLKAKEATGLPIVTEIMSADQLPLFDDVDVIQVGARNIQNFDLLKVLGKQNKPILLKRGMSTTLKELLMSAEYVMSGGNDQVILCERGIRTFETYTRNTLDLSAVPALRELSHLPIIIDPSHATGIASMVEPMSMAAAACGADGIMVEVHNNPSAALCDGAQSLTPAQFRKLADKVMKVHEAVK